MVERVSLVVAAVGRRRVSRVLDALHRPAEADVPDLSGAVVGKAAVAFAAKKKIGSNFSRYSR